MEDKKTLIAFVIIGILLLLMPKYYEWMGLTPEEPPSGVEREESGVPQRPTEDLLTDSASDKEEAAVYDSSLLPSSTVSSVHSFTPQKIVVRTPLQQLVFSTEGGVLLSCQLLQYWRVDGQQVELIPPGGRGLALSLKRFDDDMDLSAIEFVADRSRLEVLDSDVKGVLRLVANLGGEQRLEKVLTFYPDRYSFDLQIAYRGFDEDTEVFLTWTKGIALTEKIPETDVREARLLAYFNEELTKIQVSNNDEKVWEDRGPLQWAGVRNKYFLAAFSPQGEQRHRIHLQAQGVGSGLLPDYSFIIGARLSRAGSWDNLIYLGPLDYDRLLAADLDKAIDFGWPIVRQISKLLLVIFKATYTIIPNYGWIIVIFSVAIKVLVYPLTHKTYQSTTKMQALQPKIAALKEKYKNDQQKLSRETMKLYKEEGVNPLGGCLPMVLQMPIFFALYNLFGHTIELRQAPFMLWITDLSVPDELLLAGFSVRILPLLMAISMLFQQKMTMKDPKQAFMVYLMPVMMVFIFWSMSSGLVLYWTIFNVLSVAQQLLITHFKKEPALT